MKTKISIITLLILLFSVFIIPSAFAATIDITFVSPDLNGKLQLVAPGTSVTVQASATGATYIIYWVADPVNDFHWVKTDYNYSTLTLTNLMAGTYLIDAYAYDANWTQIGSKRETVNVGSSVSLSVSGSSAYATASRLGSLGSSVYYSFWYQNASGWYCMQGYQANNSVTIPSGATTVAVYAKDSRAYLGNQGWETCVSATKNFVLPVPAYSQLPYDNLCWATSAAMIISYYLSDNYNREVAIAEAQYGSTDPSVFNQGGNLWYENSAIYRYTGKLGTVYNSGSLPFANLQTQINNGKPIGSVIQNIGGK